MAMIEPLLDTHIADIDGARMQFIDALHTHILKLREELRVNEIILQSVIKSLSKKNEKYNALDELLHKERMESSYHEPVVLSKEELERMQLILLGDMSSTPATRQG